MILRVLLVGDFSSDFHEKALSNSLVSLGHEVKNFAWSKYFKGNVGYIGESGILSKVKAFRYRFENKYLFGPILNRINRDLIQLSEDFKPNFIFIYRGTHIFPETVKSLKSISQIFGYNNDDPFSRNYSIYQFRHFVKALNFYDHIFAYRLKNIEDYKNRGVKSCSLLRSFYLESRNFPIQNLENNEFSSDVSFIGHFEKDSREASIKLLLESEINFKLFGPHWELSEYYDLIKQKLGRTLNLKENYNLALNSTKIALVFFSKINNDTYTRRCFEIPAAGVFMLSQYSDDMDSLFKEGKEAEYFRDDNELMSKIRYYLKNDKERKKIAERGYRKLKESGHEARSRVEQIISEYKGIKSLKA